LVFELGDFDFGIFDFGVGDRGIFDLDILNFVTLDLGYTPKLHNMIPAEFKLI
jgi:hypothetical protein